jgi:hypothetical protein
MFNFRSLAAIGREIEMVRKMDMVTQGDRVRQCPIGNPNYKRK